VVSENTLPAATQELVELRAGQINGCGFSTDMHTKDSRTPGGPRRGSTWSRPAAWRLTWSSSAPSDRSQTVPADHVQEDYADFWVSRFCLTWEDAPS
jgi:AhpD family alkylhydroperoxidase